MVPSFMIPIFCFFKNMYSFLFYEWFHVWFCVYHVCAVYTEARKRNWILEIEVIDGCELPWGCCILTLVLWESGMWSQLLSPLSEWMLCLSLRLLIQTLPGPPGELFPFLLLCLFVLLASLLLLSGIRLPLFFPYPYFNQQIYLGILNSCPMSPSWVYNLQSSMYNPGKWSWVYASVVPLDMNGHLIVHPPASTARCFNMVNVKFCSPKKKKKKASLRIRGMDF